MSPPITRDEAMAESQHRCRRRHIWWGCIPVVREDVEQGVDRRPSSARVGWYVIAKPRLFADRGEANASRPSQALAAPSRTWLTAFVQGAPIRFGEEVGFSMLISRL
jgi:hypothetical protein